MNPVVIIKDLIFKHQDQVLFDRFNLEIEKGTWTSIIGPNGSGKSTLIQILLGFHNINNYANISRTAICKDNYKTIRKRVGIVLENPDQYFVAETVLDEIAFSLENMGYSKEDIKTRISTVTDAFKIESILECYPHLLSGGQKQLVALASALAMKPEVLIIDDGLSMMDTRCKQMVTSYLSELNHKGLSIIHITHDVEDCLLGTDVVVMDHGAVRLQGTKADVFKDPHVFEEIGLNLPFLVELSNKLSYYELLDGISFDVDGMVDTIWK